MWQILLVCSALACGTVVISYTDTLIDEGKWTMESVKKCPEPEKYAFDVDIKRKMINRTHDGFWGPLELKEEINDSFGVKIEMCTKVDGGCKLVQVIVDPCFCEFIMKHAPENFVTWLNKIGLFTSDCPIPKGSYNVDGYIFDYSELPEKGLLGEFQATAYLTRDGDNVGCIMSDLNFAKVADDDDDE